MRRKFIFISRKIGTEEASKPKILVDIFTLAVTCCIRYHPSVWYTGHEAAWFNITFWVVPFLQKRKVTDYERAMTSFPIFFFASGRFKQKGHLSANRFNWSWLFDVCTMLIQNFVLSSFNASFRSMYTWTIRRKCLSAIHNTLSFENTKLSHISSFSVNKPFLFFSCIGNTYHLSEQKYP